MLYLKHACSATIPPVFYLSVCGMTNTIPWIRLQTHIWLICSVFVQKKIKYSRSRLIYYGILQLAVEPHPLQSMDPCCSLTTQQRAQWWCSNVTLGLSLKEWWQQCVGGMVNGRPTQEVSPAAPDPYPHPHSYSLRHLYWLQVLHRDLVRVNSFSIIVWLVLQTITACHHLQDPLLKEAISAPHVPPLLL